MNEDHWRDPAWLRSVRAWIDDRLCLAPYADRYDGDLTAAVDTALRLGWACRAVNGHVPGDDDQTVTRLRMFLDGTP